MTTENASQPIKDMMRKVSLFEGLEDGDIETLIPLFQKRKFPRGVSVVEAQTPGDSLYLIETGELKVCLFDTHEKDKEVILAILKEGDFFGEMALLDDKPRSANVIALKSTLLYELSREDFMGHVEAHPKILINMLKQVFDRLRKADAIRRDLALLDVYGRVARTLLQLAQEEGEHTEAGVLIRKPPSQQQMAGMLGASRETINRVINEFARSGAIKKEGRQLLINKESVLRDQIKLPQAHNDIPPLQEEED